VSALTTAATNAAVPTDGEYEEHREVVLAVLAKRFPRFAPDERLEMYHEAWAWALKKRERGEQIDNLKAYLIQSAGYEAMRIATDKRLPEPRDPEDLVSIPDDRRGPDERVLIEDQVRICREVIEGLGERHRDVVKLRYDVQMAPPDIRAALGLSERQYKRLAKESSEALEQRVLELNDGTWSRRQRSLLVACLRGIASDGQRAEAQRRLDRDPHVAALYRELNESIGRAAALLPLPAIADAGSGGRLAAALESTRDALAGLVTGTKQQATSVYVRAADTTPLAGARPGAVAAAVTGCIAFGGGTATYCTVEGIPDAIRAPLGIEQPVQEERVETPAEAVETVQFAPSLADEGGADTAATSSDPAPKPKPEPTPVPAAAPDTSNSGEFGTEQSSASSAGAGSYNSSPQPAPAPPAPGGDLGFEE
jgi:RNA polymerase sigma factor (sigma-70 family)